MTFKGIKTVYSYYMPEIRALIDNVTRKFPHETFLSSTEGEGLDNFHKPIIKRFIDYHREDVPGLSEFEYSYPTSGSEEGIREYFTKLSLEVKHGRGRPLYMFAGDYEGYKEVAKAHGLFVTQVAWDVDPSNFPAGVWFISNPSARAGHILTTNFIQQVGDAGHMIFYDLAYLGTTDPDTTPPFNIRSKNIEAVVVSFSKPYGLFYHRLGFMFSRCEIDGLTGNKWFKNVFSLILADEILKTIDAKKFAKKYKKIQEKIIAKINQEEGLKLQAAEPFLLANLDVETARLSPEQREKFAIFMRAGFYRFCLTRYFREMEPVCDFHSITGDALHKHNETVCQGPVSYKLRYSLNEDTPGPPADYFSCDSHIGIIQYELGEVVGSYLEVEEIAARINVRPTYAYKPRIV